MSDDALKAGHAPAVKVGGMRVVQNRKKSESDKAEAGAASPEEVLEIMGSSPPKTQQVVSGAVTKGDKDFTSAAVKSFHEKPAPTHDPKPRPAQNTQNIHQPR